jgi:Asp-tRNA(Asn)/Glu-tRNA(Gln) amidotransferase B subunit
VKLLGFFVGKVMKAMKGAASPAVVNAVLRRKLGG